MGFRGNGHARRFVSRHALALLLLVSAACNGSNPAGPTLPPAPGPSAPAPAPPPSTGSSRTFSFIRYLDTSVPDHTRSSYFVLRDDETFVLQYVGGLGYQYRGRYVNRDGAITFDWDGSSVAGPWGAVGTLDGDLLTVRYNSLMQMTDFVDAVYVFAR